MKQKLIIGDCHGCYKTLMALIKKLPHNNICFTGDLIDRGPESMKVMDFVIDGGYDCTKGNHEDMMERANGQNIRYSGVWGMNGGFETRHSYRDESGKIDEAKIKKHVEWIKNLPVAIIYDKIVNESGDKLMISHSMASPAFQDEDNLSKEEFEAAIMWDRCFDQIKPIEGMFNVFGHTVQEFGPLIKDDYACIDTGAVFSKKPLHKPNPYGVLTALEYPSMKVYTQENIDDQKR